MNTIKLKGEKLTTFKVSDTMIKERTYYIGLLKDGNTVIVQMVTNKDCLSCELWQYFGAFINTKKRMKANKGAMLTTINSQFNTNFTKIEIQ